MRSLSFAILNHLTKVKEACADDITNTLREDYISFKDLKKKAVTTALKTAKAIGIVEETRCQLDKGGKVKVYYRAYKDMVQRRN